MPDEPRNDDPWSTVQLVPPGPNGKFAGFVRFPELTTEVLPVDYLALQELVTKGDDDDDDDVQSRVVPVVVEPTGMLRFLEEGSTDRYGFACLAATEAGCVEHLGKILAEVRRKLTPAEPPAAPAPTTPAVEGTPDAA